MTDIIRVTIAIRSEDVSKTGKIAEELRSSEVATKLQQYISNIAGPSAIKGVELVPMDGENLVHACSMYTHDDCDVCRRTASRSLNSTQRAYF